jgi:hypothetical protein
MSAARNTRRAGSSPAKQITVPSASTITLPTLSALFAPALNATNTNNTVNKPCNCGSCCQTSTTVCLTFDTTWLQTLVNSFPKIQITNNNSCVDNDCGCDDVDETGK